MNVNFPWCTGKNVEVLLPSAGSSFGFQQCPIRVTGLDFEAWLDIGTWAPWVGSPAACVKPVCNTAAAELDILEWGPKITRSLPGGISTLRHWWLASKKYWRQRWRGNSGSTAWSGQDHSFVVFSTHLGRGNLKSQSQVQGLLDYFIQCLFYFKYIKGGRLLHHQTPHWPKPP